MSWNEERIELLRQLWDKGISASQIAEQLGGGITRNAVIGKAHRLNLKSRPSPVKPDAAKKAAAAVAKAAAQVASSAEAKSSDAKSAEAKNTDDKPAPALAQTTSSKASKAQASQKASAAAQPAAPAQIVAEPSQDAAALQPAAAVKANKLAQVEAAFATSLPPSLDATPMPTAQPIPSQKRTKAAASKSPHVTLLDLTDKICKWPIGHPSDEDFHFCGKPVNPGTPYCVEHCAVAYQAQLPRRDKRPGALPAPKFRV
jgi:GcrA cell cycle regulator